MLFKWIAVDMEWKEVKEENDFILFNELIHYPTGFPDGALFVYDERFEKYFKFYCANHIVYEKFIETSSFIEA